MYADAPAVRARQVVADLVWVLAVVVSIAVGRAVAAAVSGLADPARRLAGGAQQLGAQLDGAAGRLGRVPLLGDEVASPLGGAADGARSLADGAAQQVAAVAHLATVLGLVTALVPIVLVTLLRGVPRWRWARRAAEARRLLAGPDGDDLLALRALQTRSSRELAAVSPAPVRAWREGRADVVAGLADLELAALGVGRRER